MLTYDWLSHGLERFGKGSSSDLSGALRRRLSAPALPQGLVSQLIGAALVVRVRRRADWRCRAALVVGSFDRKRPSSRDSVARLG